MLFPFRTSTIFKNRWVALLWAAGICFMASEIVDSVSGVTARQGSHAPTPAATSQAASDDPVAVALGNAPPPQHLAPPPPEDVEIAR